MRLCGCFAFFTTITSTAGMGGKSSAEYVKFNNKPP
jgi:hypothetical protein